MKIKCLCDLDNIRLTQHGNFKDLNNLSRTYIYKESCKNCGEPFLTQKQSKGLFCSIKCGTEGKHNPKWRGGVSEKNLPYYNTYALQINYAESVRRNIKNKNILEVKCAYCGKWYIPTMKEIVSRINALNGNFTECTEYRLYCSNSCKQECPVYNQRIWPKGFKQATSREVQPQLRQLVFKRDGYKCIKCNSEENLHCHHVEGIRWEPLESADIDKCITVCKQCHKAIHKIPGCGYNEMKCV